MKIINYILISLAIVIVLVFLLFWGFVYLYNHPSVPNKDSDYTGYFYIENTEIPIAGVCVIAQFANIRTYSNSNGYFKIPSQSMPQGGILIMSKEGYSSDTLRTITSLYGETFDRHFLDDKIYMKPIKNK
jgi:hypothetical protein